MGDRLLISQGEITQYSPLGGNIDVDKYSFVIEEAQIFVIENILGTKLYNKILDDYSDGTITGDYKTLLEKYIHPILIFTVSAEYILMANFNVANAGAFKYVPENTQPLSQGELESKAQGQRAKADVYIERMQRYLCDSNIEEYDAPQDNNYDNRPDRDVNTYGGWRLSRRDYNGTNANRELWRDIWNDEGR